ncbi:MAG: DUF3137 domain-containing protein [Eubacteriales bacterium]
MSQKGFVKLSEAELLEQIAQYEKREINLKCYGVVGAVIGVIGSIISMVLEDDLLGLIFTAVVIVSVVTYYLGIRLRKKAESLVREQLDDFFEAELERVFGPRMRTSEMRINEPFLNEIRPVDLYWNRCSVWRFYEGNYHGTHFSAANVELYELKQVTEEDSFQNATETVFEGVVLRCRNICDPAPDIALRKPWADHHKSDLVDPEVFRQHFSVRTADNQPADDLVTPELRELIQKLESLSNEYTVTALIFRNGEAILAIGGYAFAEGLPSGGKSLQNLDGIRRLFTASLTEMGDLIDILRDSCGGK